MKFLIGFDESVHVDLNELNGALGEHGPFEVKRQAIAPLASGMILWSEIDPDLPDAVLALEVILSHTGQKKLYVRGVEGYIPGFYDLDTALLHDQSWLFCGFPVVFSIGSRPRVDIIWSFVNDCVESGRIGQTGFQDFLERLCYVVGVVNETCPVGVAIRDRPAGKLLRLVK